MKRPTTLLHGWRTAILSTTLLAACSPILAQVAAWETAGSAGNEPSLAATTANANLTIGALTRGAGLNATALSNAFSSNNFLNTGLAGAQSANKYLQFTISPNSGWEVSLSTLDVNFRRSGTGPNAFQWQYSLDGFTTAGVNIGAEFSYTGTASNGEAQAQIDLSAVPALQDVPAGTTITFRLFGWGTDNSGGTFAIGRLAGNDLAIGGTVEPGAGPMCGISLGAASAVCNSSTPGPGNDTYDLSIPYTGIDAAITVINNSGSGTVGGDDPALVSDGTIVISGISEDDAYNITFTSPCDALTVSDAAPSCEPPFPGTTISFDDDLLWTAGSVILASYASDHVYAEADWLFTGGPALRNAIAGQDGFPGALGTFSWRLQNIAGVDWRATYQGGDILENFGFSVRRWDGSPSPAFEVSYSIDGGSTFSAAVAVIDNAFLDNSSDWKVFSHTIASPAFVVPGQFVVRVVSTGSTERIMVDDFTFETSPGPACTFALEGIPNFDENTCACELGYFATITDIGGNDVITDCTICPPGSFCPDGIDVIPCPVGTFSDQAGLSACAPCAAGFANGSVGQTECSACPPGSFSDFAGAEECALCPANTYNPASAQTECLACPNGETSGEGATECVPDGGPCTEDLTLTINTDGAGNETTWAILPVGGGAPLCSGGPYVNNASIEIDCCVPAGCYRLEVYDAAGNGMSSGGYILTTEDGRRIIDNRDAGDFGSLSALANDGAFCLPLGADQLIQWEGEGDQCDKLDYVAGVFPYFMATPNAAVSAAYQVGEPLAQQDNGYGYQFWIFNANGDYNRRVYNPNGVYNGWDQNDPERASYLRWEWIQTQPVPCDMPLNVRVRSRVGGVYTEFGPACRALVLCEPVSCPTTKLLDDPNNANYSCGVVRSFGGSQRLYANPVAGANRYQFRITNAGEGYARNIASNNPALILNWINNPMTPSDAPYEVRVRVSFDGGANYCDFGEVCLVTIVAPPAVADRMAGAAQVSMWPNPNRDGQLWLSVEGASEEISLIAVDIFDMYGKRVFDRMVPVQQGMVNTVLELDGRLAAGMYMVNITMGGERRVERLVIAR